MNGSLHYAEVVDLSDMRFNGSLEYIEACRRSGVRTDFLAVHSRIAELRGAGSHAVEEVHEPAHTHILETGTAYHRIHRPVCIDGFESVHDLLVGQSFAQELVQQRLVCFCGCLGELRTHLLYAVRVLGRDVLEFRSTAFRFPYKHLTLQYVDYGIEAGAGVDGELNQSTFIAKVLFQLVESALEICVLMVAFVDYESKRFVCFLYETEVILGSYLYSSVGGKDDERGSAHLQGCYGAAAEVIATGAVNDIQFLALELDVTYR